MENDENALQEQAHEGLVPQLFELYPWADEETRIFYDDLPDVAKFLSDQYVEKQLDESANDEEESEDEDYRSVDDSPVMEKTLDTVPASDHTYYRDPPQDNEGDPEVTVDLVETRKPDEAATSESMAAGNGSATTGNRRNRLYFKEFLERLPWCNNVESIDNAAVEFLLVLNTAHNRKRLVQALCDVKVDGNQTQLNLVPMYARFAAVISLVSPDMGQELCHMLKVEFAYHLRKDRIDIMKRIKVVRFIGELVMFGICGKIEALDCLNCLLDNFTRHNIELSCELLEVCGIYLYNRPNSRMRTSALLEQMMHKKTDTPMLEWQEQLVENVYRMVKEPQHLWEARHIGSPIRMYIRKLLFQNLNERNTYNIAQLLLCMNWNDARMYKYAVESFICARDIEVHPTRNLAELLSYLVKHQERAVDLVTKSVLFIIRGNLVTYDKTLVERRIAMVQYLGELYNYTLVTSLDILQTLDAIITCGVSLTHTGPPSNVDPPHSMLRLDIVLVLLDTCGQYFDMGVNRRVMDEFLYSFQRYYWYKKSHPYFAGSTARDTFPFRMNSMFLASLCRLRPQMTMFTSFNQASAAVHARCKRQDEFYRWVLQAQHLPVHQSLIDEDSLKSDEASQEEFIHETAASSQMDETPNGDFDSKVAFATSESSDESSSQSQPADLEWMMEFESTMATLQNKTEDMELQMQEPDHSFETPQKDFDLEWGAESCLSYNSPVLSQAVDFATVCWKLERKADEQLEPGQSDESSIEDFNIEA